jgi:hypothetical protein
VRAHVYRNSDRERMMRSALNAVCVALLLLCAADGVAQTAEEKPQANPGRPTVSTPATLTPVGYLQFENGTLFASESPEFDTRFGINQVTKLAVASRLQVLALTEPLVHSRDGSVRENHVGEVFAGLQGVVAPGHGVRPTISVSYIRRLYESPAPEVDIGTFRQSVTLLVSGDLGKFHYDLNGIVTEQAEKTVRRGQFGQTLSVSHPAGRATISFEAWHFSQPLTNGNAVGLLCAGSYPIRGNLVVDAGMDHGLTGSSTQWEGFAGFTYLLPHRLWRAR